MVIEILFNYSFHKENIIIKDHLLIVKEFLKNLKEKLFKINEKCLIEMDVIEKEIEEKNIIYIHQIFNLSERKYRIAYGGFIKFSYYNKNEIYILPIKSLTTNKTLQIQLEYQLYLESIHSKLFNSNFSEDIFKYMNDKNLDNLGRTNKRILMRVEDFKLKVSNLKMKDKFYKFNKEYLTTNLNYFPNKNNLFIEKKKLDYVTEYYWVHSFKYKIFSYVFNYDKGEFVLSYNTCCNQLCCVSNDLIYHNEDNQINNGNSNTNESMRIWYRKNFRNFSEYLVLNNGYIKGSRKKYYVQYTKLLNSNSNSKKILFLKYKVIDTKYDKYPYVKGTILEIFDIYKYQRTFKINLHELNKKYNEVCCIGVSNYHESLIYILNIDLEFLIINYEENFIVKNDKIQITKKRIINYTCHIVDCLFAIATDLYVVIYDLKLNKSIIKICINHILTMIYANELKFLVLISKHFYLKINLNNLEIDYEKNQNNIIKRIKNIDEKYYLIKKFDNKKFKDKIQRNKQESHEQLYFNIILGRILLIDDICYDLITGKVSNFNQIEDWFYKSYTLNNNKVIKNSGQKYFTLQRFINFNNDSELYSNNYSNCKDDIGVEEVIKNDQSTVILNLYSDDSNETICSINYCKEIVNKVVNIEYLDIFSLQIELTNNNNKIVTLTNIKEDEYYLNIYTINGINLFKTNQYNCQSTISLLSMIKLNLPNLIYLNSYYILSQIFDTLKDDNPIVNNQIYVIIDYENKYLMNCIPCKFEFKLINLVNEKNDRFIIHNVEDRLIFSFYGAIITSNSVNDINYNEIYFFNFKSLIFTKINFQSIDKIKILSLIINDNRLNLCISNSYDIVELIVLYKDQSIGNYYLHLYHIVHELSNNNLVFKFIKEFQLDFKFEFFKIHTLVYESLLIIDNNLFIIIGDDFIELRNLNNFEIMNSFNFGIPIFCSLTKILSPRMLVTVDINMIIYLVDLETMNLINKIQITNVWKIIDICLINHGILGILFESNCLIYLDIN